MIVQVPRARAHAIKSKKPLTVYSLTSWGSTTTVARSPTTTHTMCRHTDEDSVNFDNVNYPNVRRKKSKAVVSTVD